jgi:hypothetical protein
MVISSSSARAASNNANANTNARGPGPSNRHPSSSVSSFSERERVQQATQTRERRPDYANRRETSSTSSTLPFRQPPPPNSNTTRGEKLGPVGLSSTQSSISSGSTLPKRKPSLGIFIPSFTNAGSFFFAGNSNSNNGAKSPLKRKPVPDGVSPAAEGPELKRKSRVSQSQRSSRSRFSTLNASNNGAFFPPRKSSLNSPLPSPGQNRSASISTPGHPNLVGVELVFRDLDQYVSTPEFRRSNQYLGLGYSRSRTANVWCHLDFRMEAHPRPFHRDE